MIAWCEWLSLKRHNNCATFNILHYWALRRLISAIHCYCWKNSLFNLRSIWPSWHLSLLDVAVRMLRPENRLSRPAKLIKLSMIRSISLKGSCNWSVILCWVNLWVIHFNGCYRFMSRTTSMLLQCLLWILTNNLFLEIKRLMKSTTTHKLYLCQSLISRCWAVT